MHLVNGNDGISIAGHSAAKLCWDLNGEEHVMIWIHVSFPLADKNRRAELYITSKRLHVLKQLLNVYLQASYALLNSHHIDA